MSEYNWCHGSKCHTYKTQSRIRGVGNDKVLRTRKIKINANPTNVWNYFCNQGCLFDFICKNITRLVTLEPRNEALETKVEIKKETYETYNYGNYGREPYQATRNIINILDTNNEII